MGFRNWRDPDRFDALLRQHLYFPERNLVTSPRDLGLPYENIWLTTSDDVRIHGWLIPNIDSPATLLFLHGNAGNISHRLDNVKRLFDAGVQIFILDYRGYGQSDGRPSEQGTYNDASAAWQWLTDEIGGPIVVFGRSLGGAVAAWLAAQPDVAPAGLILESTFTRGRDVAAVLVPIPGLATMIPDFYPTLDHIERIEIPLLLIHGSDDELIAVSHARRLYEAASEPKSLYIVDGGRHNDTYVVGGNAYLRQLTKFIEEQTK